MEGGREGAGARAEIEARLLRAQAQMMPRRCCPPRAASLGPCRRRPRAAALAGGGAARRPGDGRRRFGLRASMRPRRWRPGRARAGVCHEAGRRHRFDMHSALGTARSGTCCSAGPVRLRQLAAA
eukprot:scaffold1158_cov351-Prasinococcus_capsulatus_cf.AAC.1